GAPSSRKKSHWVRGSGANNRSAGRRPVLLQFIAGSTQFLVDRLDVKLLRVELVADPFEHFLVLRVAGVLDGLQEVAVAPRPAAILRWAGPLAVDTARIMDARFIRKRLL